MVIYTPSLFLALIQWLLNLFLGSTSMAFLISLLNFPRIVSLALGRVSSIETQESDTLDRLTETEATVKDLKLAVFDLEYKQMQQDTALRRIQYGRSSSLNANKSPSNSVWSGIFGRRSGLDIRGRAVERGNDLNMQRETSPEQNQHLSYADAARKHGRA